MVSPEGCSMLRSISPANSGTSAQTMPLTRSFHETVQARARRNIEFRRALLVEATQTLLDGNLDEGRAALRSCINATIGFEKLGAVLDRSPKSLMRMFGPSGNPTAENLLGVVGVLQRKAEFASRSARSEVMVSC